MKIEVGKTYKTRNGNIVFIHSVSRKGEGSIVGEIGVGSFVFRAWRSDGVFPSVYVDNQWDLVSEVKEKLKVTFHMDMPEDFKGLTADEIKTKLKKIFTNSRGKINILNPIAERGFACDDIIVSGITEE